MGAEWIESRYRVHGMTLNWSRSCGICGSHEQVWLIEMEHPWKYVDGVRRQAPGLSTDFLDKMSYEKREAFLSTVGHVSTYVLCQKCIDTQIQQEPYVKDGIWTGKPRVKQYIRKLHKE